MNDLVKRFINTLSEDDKLLIIERGLGITLPRRAPRKIGYQMRDISYPLSVSNNIPSPQPYPLKKDWVRQYYNRMGAVIPPVPVRERVPDKRIIQGTPCASRVKTSAHITSKHNAFYDVRTGEIVLVVLADSKADQFYTRYYEGKATFPYIAKMSGEVMQRIIRADIPPIMLVVNGEPVYWGNHRDLALKIKHDKTFAPKIDEAKSCWLQLQPPMICEPVMRPHFDVPRLRFVLSLESTMKRTVKGKEKRGSILGQATESVKAASC